MLRLFWSVGAVGLIGSGTSDLGLNIFPAKGWGSSFWPWGLQVGFCEIWGVPAVESKARRGPLRRVLGRGGNVRHAVVSPPIPDGLGLGALG